MESSTEMGRRDLVSRLGEALRGEPDVILAYLYGSRVEGSPGPLSDVDVAVLLGPPSQA